MMAARHEVHVGDAEHLSKLAGTFIGPAAGALLGAGCGNAVDAEWKVTLPSTFALPGECLFSTVTEPKA
jgi:hypothetical protein